MFSFKEEVEKAKANLDYTIPIPEDFEFFDEDIAVYTDLRDNDGYLIRDHKLVKYDGKPLPYIDEALIKLCSGHSHVFSGLTITFDVFSVCIYVAYMLNILNFSGKEVEEVFDQIDFNKYIKVLEENYTVEKLPSIGVVVVKVY